MSPFDPGNKSVGSNAKEFNVKMHKTQRVIRCDSKSVSSIRNSFSTNKKSTKTRFIKDGLRERYQDRKSMAHFYRDNAKAVTI